MKMQYLWYRSLCR